MIALAWIVPLWIIAVCVLLLVFMGADDPTEDETVEEPWPTPDYFDDVPMECLSRDEQVKRLETWL